MSAINTNGINVSFPEPGVNNNSQGFRDNSAAIKSSLNIAATEITDLQNNVVLKSSLTNSIVNNDMAGTIISNALTRSFRASTYNLGNALSGTVLVDVSRGDVQFGSIAGNIDLQFVGWTPVGQNNVKLELAVGNSNAVVSFPESVSANTCYGVTTLENFTTNGPVSMVSIPAGVCQLDYRLSTVDCGGNITIEPYNRPRRSTQIRQRTPSPNGLPGDTPGTIAVDANYVYICTGNYASTTTNFRVSSTASAGNTVTHTAVSGSLTVNDPIIFTGVGFGRITIGTVYYIKSLGSGTMVLSETRIGGVAGAEFAVTDDSGVNLIGDSYNGTPIWSRTVLTTW